MLSKSDEDNKYCFVGVYSYYFKYHFKTKKEYENIALIHDGKITVQLSGWFQQIKIYKVQNDQLQECQGEHNYEAFFTVCILVLWLEFEN